MINHEIHVIINHETHETHEKLLRTFVYFVV